MPTMKCYAQSQKTSQCTKGDFDGRLHIESEKIDMDMTGWVASSCSRSKQSQQLQYEIEGARFFNVHFMWCLLRGERSMITCFYFLF